jgi:oligosaccharide repeat unit polymerase
MAGFRIALAFLLVTMVAALAGLAASHADAQTGLAALSAAGFTAIVVGLLLFAFASGRWVLDTPIYLAMVVYFAFMGVSPFAAQLFDSPVGASIDGKTFVVIWMGCVFLLAGYVPAVRGMPHKPKGGCFPSASVRELTVMLQFGLLYTLIGLAGIAWYLHTVGGITFLLSVPYQARGDPHLQGIPFMLLRPGLFFFLAWASAQSRHPAWTWIGVAVYVGFDTLWFGPLRGSRFQIITLTLTVIFLLKMRPGSGVLYACFAAASFLLVLVWGSIRGMALKQAVSGAYEGVGVGRAAVTGIDAPLDTVNKIVLAVPERIPYSYGRWICISSLGPVPRVLWPTKQEGEGDWLQDTFEPTSAGKLVNTVPTWIGELYLDFGQVGVILGTLFMGVFCRWVYRWNDPCTAWNGHGYFGKVMYAVWFPVFLPWIWGGSNEMMWHFVANVLPMYPALVVLGRQPAPVSVKYSDVSGSHRLGTLEAEC